MSAPREGNTAPADRRVVPRRQPTLGTVCRLSSDSGEWLGTGLVWNLSSSGLSLFVPHRLEPGRQIEGELSTTDGRTRLPLNLRVAHTSSVLTGDYFIGAQFHRALTAEEMRPFLGPTAT